MADLQFDQFVDVFDKPEPIGRNTKENVGKLLPNQAKRFHGLDRIGEWIAGAGDADYREIRHARIHRFQIGHRLERRKQCTGNTGTVLVGTVKRPITVITLQIAAGSNRQVNPRRPMKDVGVETRMVRNIQFRVL